MVLSRDVERACLSCTILPLEVIKIDCSISLFLLNISGTPQVKGLKFLPQTNFVGCLVQQKPTLFKSPENRRISLPELYQSRLNRSRALLFHIFTNEHYLT